MNVRCSIKRESCEMTTDMRNSKVKLAACGKMNWPVVCAVSGGICDIKCLHSHRYVTGWLYRNERKLLDEWRTGTSLLLWQQLSRAVKCWDFRLSLFKMLLLRASHCFCFPSNSLSAICCDDGSSFPVSTFRCRKWLQITVLTYCFSFEISSWTIFNLTFCFWLIFWQI